MKTSASQHYLKLDSNGQPTDSNDYVAVRVPMLDDATNTIKWLDFSRDTLPCGRVNHAEAVKAAADLELCGSKDWRLATRKELLCIIDDTRIDPACDPIFNCESSWYWTSTPDVEDPDTYAWGVYFYGGVADRSLHSDDGFVRAVRVSQ